MIEYFTDSRVITTLLDVIVMGVCQSFLCWSRTLPESGVINKMGAVLVGPQVERPGVVPIG